MSRFLIKGSAAIILALLLSWAYLFTPQAFFSLNNTLRDYFFLLRGELPKSNRIVIVDIDEASLKQFGQWPWPRNIVADLLNRLSDAGAGIIGLDIVFAEADQTSPHRMASKMECNMTALDDYDSILADAFAATPTVGGYVFTFGNQERKGEEPPLVPAVFIEKGFDANPFIIKPDGIVLNLDKLQKKLSSSGFFNIIPDEGAMVRRVPLIIRYEGMLYPSLALEMIRIYNDVSTVHVDGDDGGVQQIRLGDITIPTDPAGRLLVNFRGPNKHFRYISAADVLNGVLKPEDVAGMFVLLGTSAIGLYDMRSTPFNNNTPGVEIHANVLDNILAGDFLYDFSEMRAYKLLIIVGIIITIFLLLSYFESWLMLPIVIGLFYLLFKLSFYVLFTMGIVLNIFILFLAYIMSVVLSLGIDYIVATRQREVIKRIFAKKVSKAVMDDLIKSGNEEVLKVRDADVTVFFSDIRGFTGISETIGSSQKLVAMLNRYMTPIVQEIANREGTIDKFIGDAIMAYWNAPVHVENNADKAVTSALTQIKILESLNEELDKEYNVKLSIGIGIHTGRVTVGEMGSIGRSDYTIIGDNVNLASRLEGLNKVYGTTIIISADTKAQLHQNYTFRSLDLVRVKGRHEAIEVFEVIPSDGDDKQNDEFRRYETALKHYRNGEIKEAYDLFKKLTDENACKLYRLYLQRCREYLDHPDKPFDPICTMSIK